MRKVSRIFAGITALVCIMTFCFPAAEALAGGDEDGSSVSFFVATDRHAKEEGNNMPALAQMVAADKDAVQPVAGIIGGDNQNSGEYSVNEMTEELKAAFGDSIRGYYTYGSHDRKETGVYSESFFSTAEEEGVYIYSINFGQMIYQTEEQAKADSYDITGHDIEDPRGYTADTGVPIFLDWVGRLKDHKPIIIMSHVPMHVNRQDNLGALSWVNAINEAAEDHDIIFLWGHNHSREEHEDKYGPSQDYYYYLVTPGETMPVQGEEPEKSEAVELKFLYANAGYLKLGFASLLTYTDLDGNGTYDQLTLKRYSLDENYDGAFSKTQYYSPYTMEFTQWKTSVPVWLFIIIGAVVLAAALTVIILVRKKRRNA